MGRMGIQLCLGAAKGGRLTEPHHTLPSASYIRNEVVSAGAATFPAHSGLLHSGVNSSESQTPERDIFFSPKLQGGGVFKLQIKTLIKIKGKIYMIIFIRR